MSNENKIIVILSVCIIILGCFCKHYVNKYDALKLELDQAAIVAQTNTLNLEREIERLKASHDAEIEKLNTETDTLIKRIKSDAVRVHIKSNPSVSTSAGNDHRETTTGIDKDNAATLIDIAKRGDNAIIELNKCIDQYNAVREKLNQ